MPYVEWLIIGLLMAAVAISLCDPVCGGHRPRSSPKHPPPG